MEEEQNQQWDADVSALVKRFEEMVTANEAWYFDADQFEAIAEFYMESGDSQKALRVLDYAHDIFPNNLGLDLREAQVYAGMGKLSKAEKRLKAILQVEQFNEDAHLLLGSIYSQQREHHRAIHHYSKVLKTLNDEQLAGDVYIDLALEYESLGQYKSAIKVLKEALDRNQENETAIYELAYCFDMAGENEECITFYQQFIDINPFSFTAWYNLGNSYQKAGLLEKSVEAYDYCLAIEPDFSPCSFNKANALVKMDDFQGAIKSYKESIEVEGPQSVTLAYMGECYEKMMDYDMAVNYYKKALKEDELNAEAHIGLGVVYDLLDRPIESLKHFRKVLDLQVDDQEVMVLIITALRRANYFEEAIELAKRVIEDDATYPDVWMELAEVFLEMGSPKEEIYELLDEAYQQTNSNGEISYRKVAIKHLFKDKVDAFALLEFSLQNHLEKVDSLIEYYPEIAVDDRFVALHALYKK